jgi:membrane protein DedA with SNARE-associated domain/pimeloyl-ACP methyl ester carboxylesterase
MKSSPGKFRLWARRWRWILAAVYAALLLVSHLAHWVRPVNQRQDFSEFPGETSGGLRSATLQAIDGDRVLDRTIQLAYLDFPSKNDRDSAPVLLLHGSPGAADDFGGMVRAGRAGRAENAQQPLGAASAGSDSTPRLLGDYRLIAPDLPGFGHSTGDIPDYSFRAHARYVVELLDSLKIPRAHVVAFSMGGGVGLSLTQIAPERVASLTMLSAIGAQEMELLGEYHANHAVHALQLGFFRFLHEGVPMTSEAYARDIGLSYSRNFYDSDQRPLRGLINRYAGPMMIIHGRKDFLVPVEAAFEHHRLAPQSELVLSDYDHFMVFQRPKYLAPILADFVSRVEAGKVVVRATADPARIAASELPFDPKNLPKFIGVTAVVVTLLLAAATLITEDLTCVTAGVLAAQGRIGFALASFACFLGIFVGDLLLFLAGRWLGRATLRRAPVKWFIKDNDVRRSSDWFSRQGAKVILASRFLPGARLPTYFAAGALNTSFWKFTSYFFVACAVWTPLLVGLSMLLGREVIESALLGGQSLIFKVVVAGILILAIIKLSVRLSTARGRRLLISSWRRLTRWEFWPPYVFYPPVVCYVAWLMLKHRGATVFTAANPAIPGGGFIGESKAEILRGLENAGDFLPKWALIGAASPVEDRIERAKRFIAEHRLGYPMALKPDVGQRGAGVGIIKSDAELESYLRQANVDTLIQEYAPGEEFGVFYYRFPDQEKGRIFAITEKRFPSVTGDGTSTLERLILGDDRAVCMARFLLEKHADRLWQTPRAGERVQLVELGTHCRGSMFLDGGWAKTDALEAAVDRICRGFDGFYFGRFDIRAANVEDFRRGLGFKVIELNGVTSEATNIYDPKNSLFAAYRTLFEQWRIAFEIGAMNRARGAKSTPVRTLLKWALDYQDRPQAIGEKGGKKTEAS